MVDLICPRCRNTMEWLTHPYLPGGRDYCAYCEQRAALGLAPLPARPTTTEDWIATEAAERARYNEITEGYAEARSINNRINRERKAEAKRLRQQTPEWKAMLARNAPYRFKPKAVKAQIDAVRQESLTRCASEGSASPIANISAA